jgi:NADH-quinone oxidoreductase subunit G
MVMDAANKLGTYIPHFAITKNYLSRQTAVCVWSRLKKHLSRCQLCDSRHAWHDCALSADKAVKAQKAVMEFLLINHPLDCPICDQGGECQLQDLAVGYGGTTSRHRKKSALFSTKMSVLVSMEEMSRCIHCTRCVRFGQEIAGVMELGMLNRGEHSEITSFVGKTVDSELSGNMIDLCPVGALTSSRSVTLRVHGIVPS